MSLFGKKEGEGPTINMASAMGHLSKFLMAGKDGAKIKAAISGLVTEYASPDNIKKCTTGMITGLAAMQLKTGSRYVLSIQGTADDMDIQVSIFKRSEDMTTLIPIRAVFLGQITQEDIFLLLNIIFHEPDHTGQPAIGQ